MQDLYELAAQRRNNTHSPPASLPTGWQRIEDAELIQRGINTALLHDRRSGFDAGFYSSPDGKVVLAMCGTDQLLDWRDNIGQGMGLQTEQYDTAIKLAFEASESFGSDLPLNGHSLGGGLISAEAVITDTPAVTYSSAGVNDLTFQRLEFDPAKAREYAAAGMVRKCSVKNDLLTHLQEDSIPLKWALPDAIGHRIELPDPAPLSFGQRLIPGAMLKHRLDLHGIGSVMDSRYLQQLRDAEQGKAIKAPASANSVGNRLFEDAVIQLEPRRETLGLKDNASFLNTAAGIAARSADDGLGRIDHVVVQGDRLFSVHGGQRDSVYLRSNVLRNTKDGAIGPAFFS